MHSDYDPVLARRGGAATREALLEVSSRARLDDEIRRGHLVAVYPRAYCRPGDLDLERTRHHAALLSVGAPAGLSHITMVDLAVAVVTSWPLLPAADRHGPALEATRTGLLTPAGLRKALEPRTGLPGRSAQLALAAMLERGCESELELWGHERVFRGPGLRHGRAQVAVATTRGRFRLDLAYERERVGVEMDGARWHAGRAQRERDMRRDAALMAAGWVVLRFSHARLHADPAGCRADVLAVLASR